LPVENFLKFPLFHLIIFYKSWSKESCLLHVRRRLEFSFWIVDDLDKFSFKVRGYVTCVKGWKIKVYSISTRLPVNIHWSFFLCLNNFVFRNMRSFGNIRRCLATTACKPCFALYVIHHSSGWNRVHFKCSPFDDASNISPYLPLIFCNLN